jgi:hypothetical protein
MGLKTLLYVSKSLIAPADAAREIDDIVNVARTWNSTVGVSGVLISTDARFAQVLEGPDTVITALMQRISDDPRHEQVTTCHEAALDQRRFPLWSMAYSGPSLYVDRHVRPLLDPVLHGRDRRRLCERLLFLMEELARAPDKPA